LRPIEVYDARARFSELIERAAGGDEIVITRRGKPIVRLVAAGTDRGAAVRRRTAAVRRIARLRDELEIRGVDVRRLIAAGRR
jgi:prevent-host-death family protein